jgi:epoxyqueuosine reductase
MTERTTLTGAVKAAASEAGFPRVGVARAARLEDESRYLDAWLAAGRQGQMSWMEDTAEVRKDPRHSKMLASAKSVVVMAAPYAQTASFRGPSPGKVAKYAHGRDYHNVLSKRAKRVASLLQSAGHSARVAVDSKPVFERAWAERAGVGFVGKNCCLIVPGIGSHVLLACVVTTAELAPDTPIARRCGSCTRCLDACPTQAFVEPRVLDARRCISYLTIEHRGSIPEEHRSAIGSWLFGCDVCQDVCPYNETKGATQHTIEAFLPGARWSGKQAADFLAMDDEAFADWAVGSPVKRAGSEGLARNASIVLGNRGQSVHLPVLREARRHHRSRTVREAAAWGAKELSRRLADER